MAVPLSTIDRAWQKSTSAQMPEIDEQFLALPENARLTADDLR
jgi:hypothetical protein